MALVEPRPKKKSVSKVYRAEDSAGFFNTFLSQQSTELKNSKPNGHSVEKNGEKTPRRRSKEHSSGSPDPLALTPATPQSSRKRKAAHALESPSAKRTVVAENGPNTPRSTSDGRPTPFSNTISTPRVKLEPYIVMPPVPKAYRTPTNKGKQRAESDDELAGLHPDIDESPLKYWSRGAMDSVKSSGRRATGDRDDRGAYMRFNRWSSLIRCTIIAPIDKLVCLLEDVYEAEDALPPDVDLNDLPAEFFSPLTIDSASPLLTPSLIRKLTSYITKAARPMKRMRQSTRDSGHSKPPSKTNGLASVETAQLSRMLRMLERTVKAGEDLDPFGTAQSQPAPAPKSPSKKRAKNVAKGEDRRSKSKTPHPDGTEEYDDSEEVTVTDGDIQVLCRTLDLSKDSVYAADCCLALLSSERLTKQVRAERLLIYTSFDLSSAVLGRAHHCLPVYRQEPALPNHIPFRRDDIRNARPVLARPAPYRSLSPCRL